MIKRVLLIGFTIFALLVALIVYIHQSSYGEFTINEIRREYKGVIVQIYSSKSDISPTFIKIRDSSSRFQDLSVLEDVINYVELGDSLIKPKNENVLMIKRNGKTKTFFYSIISEKLRKHRKFPDEWRDKWLGDLPN